MSHIITDASSETCMSLLVIDRLLCSSHTITIFCSRKHSFVNNMHWSLLLSLLRYFLWL